MSSHFRAALVDSSFISIFEVGEEDTYVAIFRIRDLKRRIFSSSLRHVFEGLEGELASTISFL